jgi:omega-6 fatty acid desaturase (delta-12 desaturase)
VALEGSSFYKLPAVFRWFSGSIGYHHVHHLSPMIPNYNLKRCHDENELFSSIKPVGFKRSLKALNYRLWDEEKGEMVSFKKIKRI